jgi:hypothetical protein
LEYSRNLLVDQPQLSGFFQAGWRCDVLSYSFPVHSLAGKTTLDVTAQALELYQQILSPYPHRSLTVVEADFPGWDGIRWIVFSLSNGMYNLSAVHRLII